MGATGMNGLSCILVMWVEELSKGPETSTDVKDWDSCLVSNC